MANCILCNIKLGFLNKPTFNQGKLIDGNEVCFKCFDKLSKNKGLGYIKKMSTQEVLNANNNLNLEKQEIETKADKIANQIENLKLDGISKFFGRKEINELPKILLDDEELYDIVQGAYSGKMGILIATNYRLIFIDKGFMFGLKVEDFPYDKISSIQYETGLIQGKIIIMASGNRAVIDNVVKNLVQRFCDNVRKFMLTSKKNESPNQVIMTNQIDIADQILKLADLRDKGILTDEEFQQQKIKLLS